MYKNKITQSLLLAAGMSLAATSLMTTAAEVPAGVKLAKVQEIVRGNGTEVSSLDPHKTEGVPESHVIRDLMEGLVTQDADGNTIPGVAESWETKDNKTFTFHLRKDAKWSNGDPVTAQDFEYSLKRVVDPATAAPYAWYLDMTTMVNAHEIIAGKKDKETLGVKALDDHTLQIQLESALPYFVMMMAHTTVNPVHRATVEKYGDQWTRPEHFVGNGAYVIDKWVVNERITLKRSPNYWNNDKTVINKVTFLPIENQVSEMNRFLSGEIDITNELPNEHFRRLQKTNAEDVSITGNLCTYYYAFNTQKAPFDDVRVRKALSYTIDRDIITKALLGQGQKPAYAFTPDIIAGFTPDVPEYGQMTQKQRIAKAKELLAEAGYDKSNPLKFSLLYNTSENHKKNAVAISSMWKKSLGVNVTLENKEWKTFLDDKREGNYEVSRAGWCGDYNEPSTFLSLMQSNNSSNEPKYHSEAYDAIMNKALNSTSDAERNALYQQAEALLAKDMPFAPIYQYVKARLVNPHVGGYPVNNAEEKIYSKDLYIIAD